MIALMYHLSISISVCPFSILPESYVWQVGQAYVARNDKVWIQKAELIPWLESTIRKVLEESLVEQRIVVTCQGIAIPMQERYSKIDLQYFQDELPRSLPDTIQAIDDDLLNERVLAGGVRFPGLNRQLQQVKRRMVHNKKLMAQQQQGGWFGDRSGSSRGYGSNSRINKAYSYVMDLTLPLLQIFLFTFLPWVSVPRYNRR